MREHPDWQITQTRSASREDTLVVKNASTIINVVNKSKEACSEINVADKVENASCTINGASVRNNAPEAHVKHAGEPAQSRSRC